MLRGEPCEAAGGHKTQILFLPDSPSVEPPKDQLSTKNCSPKHLVLLCSFLGENGGNGQEPRLDPQPPHVGEWGCRGVTAHPGQELKTY